MRRLLVPSVLLTALWVVSMATANREAIYAAPPEEVTFSREVARIFQANCQSCHHAGDIAPFSLMTYEEAAPWAESIKSQTASRLMPPWKPAAGCGEFVGERQLTEEEIGTIAAWVEAGAPEGNPADLPPALSFPDEWKLGEPDVILANTPGGYKVPLDGRTDIYRNFPVPVNFEADRSISGYEVRPGNREIVHHVLLYIDGTGASLARDRADPGPGYTSSGGGPGFEPTGMLGGWAPGALAIMAPDGLGVLVPAGAHIVVQVHYSLTSAHGSHHGKDAARHGDEELRDETKVGLHYARTPVRKDLHTDSLLNDTFRIPAGAPRHQVEASLTIPASYDITLHEIAPHMHLLGREMKVEAVSASGQTRCLVDIGDWNFHWQGFYQYRQPVSLPAGTRLHLTAIYDNSADNPLNPHSPPIDVRWGEDTADEMCLALIRFTFDAQQLVVSSPALTSVAVQGSKLVVSGTGLLKGGRIEVDGKILPDSRAKRKAATSKADWQAAIPAGSAVSVTVLNPDGVRSAPITFVR